MRDDYFDNTRRMKNWKEAVEEITDNNHESDDSESDSESEDSWEEGQIRDFYTYPNERILVLTDVSTGTDVDIDIETAGEPELPPETPAEAELPSIYDMVEAEERRSAQNNPEPNRVANAGEEDANRKEDGNRQEVGNQKDGSTQEGGNSEEDDDAEGRPAKLSRTQ